MDPETDMKLRENIEDMDTSKNNHNDFFLSYRGGNGYDYTQTTAF